MNTNAVNTEGMKIIKTGSDFSGVGAFDYAMDRVAKKQGFKHKRVFACDWDKYARLAYIAAHGEPEYFPHDVYEREILSDPLDVYMTSPPCQAFSLAGKRQGKDDARGILFFNSYEFIKANKPRFFIFENVKGLLSDDKHNPKDEHGRTFREWINYLGGKSVNGVPVVFPSDEAVPYQIYWRVLNSKDYGVPQNRERVFIVGIRHDQDNSFSWPITEPLTKRLKDILESEVDEKYFLSDKMVNGLLKVNDKPTGFTFTPKTENDIGNTITARCFKMGADDNYIKSTNKGEGIKIIQSGRGFNKGGLHNISPPITCNSFEHNNHVCIPVLTPDRPNKRQKGRRFKEDGDPSFTITTQDRHGIFDGYHIRRLTPLECFRLQGFPDSHVEKCREAGISDSQLYKQAGNTITGDVLEKIIEKLPL